MAKVGRKVQEYTMYRCDDKIQDRAFTRFMNDGLPFREFAALDQTGFCEAFGVSEIFDEVALESTDE